MGLIKMEPPIPIKKPKSIKMEDAWLYVGYMKRKKEKKDNSQYKRALRSLSKFRKKK